MTSEFHYENIHTVPKLKALGIEFLQFPEEVNIAGKKGLEAVLAEQSAKNKDFEIVYESIKKHLELSRVWSDISLRHYLNIR